MKIKLFHVRIVFFPIFQIKRKKVEEYLLTIYVLSIFASNLSSVT